MFNVGRALKNLTHSGNEVPANKIMICGNRLCEYGVFAEL